MIFLSYVVAVFAISFFQSGVCEATVQVLACWILPTENFRAKVSVVGLHLSAVVEGWFRMTIQDNEVLVSSLMRHRCNIGGPLCGAS